MSSSPASYMLIFRETTPERYKAMSDDQRRERLDAWNSWCGSLAEQGVLQSGHPLHDQGRIVAGTRAKSVLDGPFAEAKEMIGGFFLISANSLDEATEIAQKSPSLPYGMEVEIRPIAGGCHLARSLGLDRMQ